MQVTTVGLDLAKNVFQVHGVNGHGKVVLRKQLRRDQVAAFYANPSCLFDRYGGLFERAPLGAQAAGLGPRRSPDGSAVRQAVREEQQERRADAEAICETVARPSMRFVPVKNIEQQSVLALHRVRQGFVKTRTAQANQIRGLLGEYGLVLPQGIAYIAKRVPALIEDASIELPGSFRLLIDRLLEHLKLLQRQVEETEVQIKAWHRASEASRRLEKVPGIGPLTATASVAIPLRSERLGTSVSRSCLGAARGLDLSL